MKEDSRKKQIGALVNHLHIAQRFITSEAYLDLINNEVTIASTKDEYPCEVHFKISFNLISTLIATRGFVPDVTACLGRQLHAHNCLLGCISMKTKA